MCLFICTARDIKCDNDDGDDLIYIRDDDDNIAPGSMSHTRIDIAK